MDLNRSEILEKFKKAWKDFYMVLKVLVIILTLIRIPFFVLMLIRNRMPNTALSKRLFSNSIFYPEKKKEAKLSFERCIHISFKECLRDLPYVPLGVAIILMAPWRIITIVSIMTSQVTRIPMQDTDAKRLKVHSRRSEIPKMFLIVLQKDFIAVIQTFCITITLYRTPALFSIFYRYFTSYKRYHSGVRI
jgi:hypothetical protein